MPDMKTLIEKKSSFISRQFGDLKLYICERFKKYDTTSLLIDIEAEMTCQIERIKTEIFCKIRRINMLLICLLLINIVILLLLIFRG